MSRQSERGPEPPGWSSDYFREASLATGPARRSRGLIGHVPIVAALMIVQGALEILFSLSSFGFTAMVVFGKQPEMAGLRPIAVALAIIGGLSFFVGLLRLVAGLFNLRYRRRGLGIIALAAGLVTLVTGYCAPSGIALAIYGLIVYLNEPVIAAFSLGDNGRSLADIRAAFPPPQ